MDARCTPSCVFTAHPPDQVADFTGKRGSSRVTPPNLPHPEEAKGLAVPSNDCLLGPHIQAAAVPPRHRLERLGRWPAVRMASSTLARRQASTAQPIQIRAGMRCTELVIQLKRFSLLALESYSPVHTEEVSFVRLIVVTIGPTWGFCTTFTCGVLCRTKTTLCTSVRHRPRILALRIHLQACSARRTTA